MENKPTYGISPLVAFCAEIQRQKDIAELKRSLNTNLIMCDYDNTKCWVLTQQQKDDLRIPIIPTDQPLEWLPMSITDERDICAAFGVPYELLNTSEHSQTFPRK